MSAVQSIHPVLELIAARRDGGGVAGAREDGARLALAIEGGGMRGAITGGMVLVLEELGLSGVFDHVYGASAGALNGAWFIGEATEVGMPGWSDPILRTGAIRRANLLRGRPLVDGTYLTEVIYEQFTPMPFERILASDVGFHPTATDAASGASVDLAPFVLDVASLKLALRASTALPLMSGPPVSLGGRRFFDAGVSESVPFGTAVDQGATHVLVLRSRRADEQETSEGGRSARLVGRYLGRFSAELAAAFLDRPARLARLDAELDEREADVDGVVSVMSLRPAADTPSVGRLERDHARVLAGLEAGRAAVHASIGDALAVA